MNLLDRVKRLEHRKSEISQQIDGWVTVPYDLTPEQERTQQELSGGNFGGNQKIEIYQSPASMPILAMYSIPRGQLKAPHFCEAFFKVWNAATVEKIRNAVNPKFDCVANCLLDELIKVAESLSRFP